MVAPVAAGGLQAPASRPQLLRPGFLKAAPFKPVSRWGSSRQLTTAPRAEAAAVAEEKPAKQQKQKQQKQQGKQQQQQQQQQQGGKANELGITPKSERRLGRDAAAGAAAAALGALDRRWIRGRAGAQGALCQRAGAAAAACWSCMRAAGSFNARWPIPTPALAHHPCGAGEDFSRWYLDLVAKADLADYGPVRGTMVRGAAAAAAARQACCWRGRCSMAPAAPDDDAAWQPRAAALPAHASYAPRPGNNWGGPATGPLWPPDPLAPHTPRAHPTTHSHSHSHSHTHSHTHSHHHHNHHHHHNRNHHHHRACR
jgi:hypothetical protein